MKACGSFVGLLSAAIWFSVPATGWAIAGVDKAPAPSAPHQPSFPRAQETSLKNGLRVIVVERHQLPLLAAEVLVGRGAEVDPKGLAGTASMTGSLLTKGTDKMTAPEIASTIESLGGSIDSGAGWDSSAASVVVMSDKSGQALGILADIVMHPAFKQEEIDRLKNQRLDALRVALRQPGSLARFITERVVFGSTAYGHAASGTIESIQAIQRSDIVNLYQANYRPDVAALIMIGDVTLTQARDLADKFFGSWKISGSAPNDKENVSAPQWKPEHLVVDMPDAGQAAVMVAKPAIRRDSPEYYSGLVANAVLGNGFVSRLNREIRIKRGLSYGANSFLDARRQTGLFAASAQTKNQSAAEVAALIESGINSLVANPVGSEELTSRQAVLTGSYARSLETNQGFLGQVAELVTYGLPLDTLDKYIPAINGVTTEQVTRFAREQLSGSADLIIVGKDAAFLDPLRKQTKELRVIEQKNLDLNSPGLVK